VNAPSLDVKHGLTVLTRLAARRPDQRNRVAQALHGRLPALAPVAVDVAIETGDPIGVVLAELLADHAYDDIVKGVEVLLPVQTTSLRELALLVVRKRYEAEVYQQPIQSRQQLTQAVALMNLYAVRLEGVGRLSAAAGTLVAALELLFQAGEPDDAGLGGAARILHNLAGIQADLFELAEAQQSAELAVAYHGRRVESGRGSPLELADSLNSLATITRQRDRPAEARALFEEAFATLQRLPAEAAATESVRAMAARVRHNLGAVLLELGEPAAARGHCAEAVLQIRRLHEARPDAYRLYLARYLAGNAKALHALGAPGEAAHDIDESLALFAELAQRRPDAFTDDYVKALMVQAEIDASEAGWQRMHEAARERLSQMSAEPQRALHWQAQLLRQQAVRPDTDADAAKAAAVTSALVEAERAMATETRPNRIPISHALSAHGRSLRRLGRVQEAIETGRLALRELEDESDQGVHGARALAWFALGNHFADANEPEEACAAYGHATESFRLAGDTAQEAGIAMLAWDGLQGGVAAAAAEKLLERAATATATRGGLDLPPAEAAGLWARLAVAAAHRGQATRAVSATRTSMEALGRVPGTRTEAHLDVHDQLARAIHALRREPTDTERMLGTRAARSQQAEPCELADIFDSARQCLGPRAHLEDDATTERLFTLLSSRSRHLHAIGRQDDALALLHEMLVLQRERVAARPDATPAGLGACLSMLATQLRKNQRQGEALAYFDEAISAYDTWYRRDPRAAGSDYAAMLNNRANCLWDLQRGEESVAALAGAIGILRAGVDGPEERYRYLLGNALGSYFTRTSALGMPKDDRLVGAALGG
jgi:tetratricopeptide (TPR) repeat protein